MLSVPASTFLCLSGTLHWQLQYTWDLSPIIWQQITLASSQNNPLLISLSWASLFYLDPGFVISRDYSLSTLLFPWVIGLLDFSQPYKADLMSRLISNISSYRFSLTFSFSLKPCQGIILFPKVKSLSHTCHQCLGSASYEWLQPPTLSPGNDVHGILMLRSMSLIEYLSSETVNSMWCCLDFQACMLEAITK